MNILLKLNRQRLIFPRSNPNPCTYSTIKHARQPPNLKWSSYQVRQTYLDFFCKQNQHKLIRSSSVLPSKGSGTYFTNAGMNQFKSIILGDMQATDLIDTSKYIGVANSQKCIRIGGKHNDLTEIGKDTYHHTFFEMLGNWSFGAYNTEKACLLALELLVNSYKLNINGLYFTYFAGCKELGIQADLNTKNIWLRLGVLESHILPFDMKCNFWEMDVVGPCGPCTEIHYDRWVDAGLTDQAELKKAAGLVNAGTERVIELWNLVFMNYNRTGPSSFSQLPLQVVDTGMGLERLCAVLNGLSSNYDTDLFMPLFGLIYSYTSEHVRSPCLHYLDAANDQSLLFAYRTLSDHMRSICVAISDGLVPSRNGLGGFLKFLILKCFKLSKDTFKVPNEVDMLCKMVPVVVESLREAYPELACKTLYIQQVIQNTDLHQKKKLLASEQITERYLKKLDNPTKLTAEQAWKLFKGDGSGEEISIEFIKSVCEARRISLDADGLEKILLKHHEKALLNQKNTRKDNSKFIDLAIQLNHLPKTDNSFKYAFDLDSQGKRATFKSSENRLNAKVLAVAKKSKENEKFSFVENLKLDDECIVVLDKSNFYPESGGQQSDKGLITSSNGLAIQVDSVHHVQGFTFHVGKVLEIKSPEELSFDLNNQVSCQVDSSRRFFTSLNHTAVHVLNDGLRKHFKNESSIIQTGSIVRDKSFKLEFKFNGMLVDKLSLSDLSQIETSCNELITKSIPIYINEDVSLEKVTENNSLKHPVRLLNDVLYPTRVRIVSIGQKFDKFDQPANSENMNLYSAELCCGTHAQNTSDLGKISLTNFSVVGDSTFEIDGCVSDYALEIERTDQLALSYLNTMSELYKTKSIIESTMSKYDVNTIMNLISDLSLRIEKLFQNKVSSYQVLQRVQNESLKYRPSKNQLQIVLKKYFEELLVTKQDDTIKDFRRRKFLKFESTLHHEHITGSVLRKITGLCPVLVLYNKYRNQLILYTNLSNDKAVNEYFDMLQKKLISSNLNAELIDSTKQSRVIKFQYTAELENIIFESL